jgi:hypothetical protein
MKEIAVRTCITCKWINSTGVNSCGHPILIASDSKALSDKNPYVNCYEERIKIFFGKCGRSGKLWEAK